MPTEYMKRKKPRNPPEEEIYGIWRSKSYGPTGGKKDSSASEEIEEELLR